MAGKKEAPVIDGLKLCTKCHERKPVDEFKKRAQNPSGRNSSCKKCNRAVDKERVKMRRAGDASDRRGMYLFNEDGMKPCSVCGTMKDRSGFSPDSRMASGHERRCKSCNVARSTNRVNGDLEFAARLLLRCSRKSCERGSTRRSAMQHDMTSEDIVSMWNTQNGKCALTGIQMTHVRGEGRVPTNMSLDRIDSDGGYTRDNVQLVCLQANMMKQQMDTAGLLWWAKTIVDHLYPQLLCDNC